MQLKVVIIMDRLLYSKYTITLYDILNNDKFKDYNVFENIALSKKAQTTKLIDMITSIYYDYEIATENITTFKLALENTFNQYKVYYQEKLNIYENNAIKLDDLIKDSQEVINVDLPNKNIDTEYPSRKVYTNNLSYTNLLLQRESLYDSIKDIYREFASLFNHCFNQVFYSGDGSAI